MDCNPLWTSPWLVRLSFCPWKLAPYGILLNQILVLPILLPIPWESFWRNKTMLISFQNKNQLFCQQQLTRLWSPHSAMHACALIQISNIMRRCSTYEWIMKLERRKRSDSFVVQCNCSPKGSDDRMSVTGRRTMSFTYFSYWFHLICLGCLWWTWWVDMIGSNVFHVRD